MRTIATLLLLAIAAASSADDSLDGAYERVSLTNTRTGESPEAANRKGLLIMAHGHYSMMTMNPERRFVADEEVSTWPASEQIDYLREWLDINGHTGRYEAADGKLTWYRDISENPREVGTTSILGYEWRDELLVIFFHLAERGSVRLGLAQVIELLVAAASRALLQVSF